MVNHVQLRNVGPVSAPSVARPATATPSTSFANVLAEVRGPRPVRFSAHALQRLDDRNIAISDTDKARIERAVDQAEAKGARETLLLMDQLALVVSVPNRTVITAVPRNEAEDAVFTNIDSAVLVADDSSNARKTEAIGLDPFRGSPRVAER